MVTAGAALLIGEGGRAADLGLTTKIAAKTPRNLQNDIMGSSYRRLIA
jgi:hypothetical protein